MEQKTFSIYKKNDAVKMQIGKDIFTLDETERKNIFNNFSDVKNTRSLFPSTLMGTAIMYPNGLIAATINIGKVRLSGSEYILVVYSLTPKSTSYDVNTFIITKEALESYMDALA